MGASEKRARILASESEARKGPGGKLPLPGREVRGSRTGRPLMALLDLLGRRWALRVIWELRDGRPLTFRELQGAVGGVSASVLNDRLRELRAAGIAASEAGAGYRLTAEGQALLELLTPIEGWAARWAERAGGEQ